MKHFHYASVASIALVLLASAPAEAQRRGGGRTVDGPRIVLFTGVDFAGKLGQTTIAPDGTKTTNTAGLAGSPLVGFRFSGTISRIFLLGTQFRSTWWRVDDPNVARNAVLDFSLVPELRIPVRNRGRVAVEPHLALPVGFTLNVWKNGNDSDPGFHVGVMPGLSIISRRGFGALVELGFMHHSFYAQSAGGTDFRRRLDQGSFQAGLLYAF